MNEPRNQDAKATDFTAEEAKRRFEATLRAALNTPPKPLKDRPKKRPKKEAALPARKAK